MPEPEPLQQVDRTYVRYRGRRLSYFSGCDYFRLATDARVLAAARGGLTRFGLGVGASRRTTGNHRLYVDLERRLAAFFRAPSALLISNGYATNLVVAQALARQFSHALIDERAHPSLKDAARFLDCPLIQFKHRDATDCANATRRCGPQTRLILLTDGMFAHDGSVAPLADYHQLLPADAMMLVDDAHAAGVIGPGGRGSLELTPLPRRRVIQTISLSKAFGSFGGAILGARALRERSLERSPMFIGSTPPPLPWVCAALKSLELLREDAGLHRRLARNVLYVKDAVRRVWPGIAQTPGPILAMPELEPRASRKLERALLKAGIYPPLLRYPGGPAGGTFRFVISSEHQRKQLDALIEVLTN